MPLPSLSEATIRARCSSESFVRGRQYYQNDAVLDLVLRGTVLQASVAGSDYEPYQVHVTLQGADVAQATCSCPYEWGGWCKHIVAVLLTCLYDPDAVEERPPLDQLLADLDDGQLRALLLGLVERNPALVSQVEHQVLLLRPSVQAKRLARPAGPDSRAIRRQVRTALRALEQVSYDDDRAAEAALDALLRFVEQAQALTIAGDGRTALAILEPFGEEYAQVAPELDTGYGYDDELLAEYVPALAEALLVAPLEEPERRQWAQKISRWQHRLGAYGGNDPLELAKEAARQGWEYPPLQRVLAGEITELGAWEGEAPFYADDLAQIRLSILERQGRHEEYLRLAEAEGLLAAFVLKLAQLGRVAEAVEQGPGCLATADEALAVAQALQAHDAYAAALQVGEHGLQLAGDTAPLVSWLAEVADRAADRERALRYVEQAFRAAPSLQGYRRLEALAGEQWPALRDELVQYLRLEARAHPHPRAHVEIFVHEELYDSAISAVEGKNDRDLIEYVADAVAEVRPEWVARVARRQADAIVEAGEAQRYHEAIGWLRRARAAYLAEGRAKEWRAYITDLRFRHGRKYKLMQLVDSL